jgi:hypothetical protein
MYWYSIWATSGWPLPALMTVRSFVYSGRPCPAFVYLTLIFGYFFSNRFTSFCTSGSHDQKVIVVGVFIAFVMSDCETGEVEPLLEPDDVQPASRRLAAAATAVILMAVPGLNFLIWLCPSSLEPASAVMTGAGTAGPRRDRDGAMRLPTG